MHLSILNLILIPNWEQIVLKYFKYLENGFSFINLIETNVKYIVQWFCNTTFVKLPNIVPFHDSLKR